MGGGASGLGGGGVRVDVNRSKFFVKIQKKKYIFFFGGGGGVKVGGGGGGGGVQDGCERRIEVL